MDISKAFDTLNRDCEIACGFGYKSLDLIKSYLNNRGQRTKINQYID